MEVWDGTLHSGSLSQLSLSPSEPLMSLRLTEIAHSREADSGLEDPAAARIAAGCHCKHYNVVYGVDFLPTLTLYLLPA